MKKIGETLLQLIEEEDTSVSHVINNSDLKAEVITHRLSEMLSDQDAIPNVAVASDAVRCDGDTWIYSVNLLLYSVEDILNIQQPKGIEEFIDLCLYNLLMKNKDHPYFRHDLRIVDMELDMVPQAFELFREIPAQRRQFMTNIIKLHLPIPKEPSGDEDFINAFSFGWNSQTNEAVFWHLINGSLKNYAPYYNDWDNYNEFLLSFEEDVKERYEWREMEENGQELFPRAEMETIAELYNCLTLYRQLVFIKNRIQEAVYYVENYQGITVFKKYMAK